MHYLCKNVRQKSEIAAAQGTRGGAQVSLLNIITELKKCCNHPVRGWSPAWLA